MRSGTARRGQAGGQGQLPGQAAAVAAHKPAGSEPAKTCSLNSWFEPVLFAVASACIILEWKY